MNLVEPDGTWDFIFRDCITGAGVLQTGQIDRPVELNSMNRKYSSVWTNNSITTLFMTVSF